MYIHYMGGGGVFTLNIYIAQTHFLKARNLLISNDRDTVQTIDMLFNAMIRKGNGCHTD